MSRLLPRLQQLPNLSRALHQASSSQASAASLGPSLAGDHAPSARLNPLVAVGEGLSIRLPPNDGQAYFLPAPQPRTPAGLEVRAQENAIAEHAAHSTHLWRKLSMYIALPLSLIMGVYIGKNEYAHYQHIKAEYAAQDGLDDEELAELRRPDYEYLNVRRTEYPWGRQSLFFNPYSQVPAADA